MLGPQLGQLVVLVGNRAKHIAQYHQAAFSGWQVEVANPNLGAWAVDVWGRGPGLVPNSDLAGVEGSRSHRHRREKHRTVRPHVNIVAHFVVRPPKKTGQA